MSRHLFILAMLIFMFVGLPSYTQQEDLNALKAKIALLEKELQHQKQHVLELTQQRDQFQDIAKCLHKITFGPEMFLEQAETLVEITKVRHQAKNTSIFEVALAQTFLEHLRYRQENNSTEPYQKSYNRLLKLTEKRYKRTKSELKPFFAVFGLKKIKPKKLSLHVPQEWLEGEPERREELASLQLANPAPAIKLSYWLNSSSLNLAQLQGKVVLLNFWAPW